SSSLWSLRVQRRSTVRPAPIWLPPLSSAVPEHAGQDPGATTLGQEYPNRRSTLRLGTPLGRAAARLAPRRMGTSRPVPPPPRRDAWTAYRCFYSHDRGFTSCW